MNCLDCHNMVGHNIPNPSAALDSALAEGKISPALPFIKRDALKLIEANYSTEEAGDAAIDGFSATYSTTHPLAIQNNPGAMRSATDEIRRIYHETSTPAMKTTWQSYPDNLGHQRSKGCFRCHDGAHVKVINGSATDQVIPSTCSTCHTFPQVGSSVTGLQLGVPPVSHSQSSTSSTTRRASPLSMRHLLLTRQRVRTAPPATRSLTARTAMTPAPSTSITTRCCTTMLSQCVSRRSRPAPTAISRCTAPRATPMTSSVATA